jgi:hypothetical protein
MKHLLKILNALKVLWPYLLTMVFVYLSLVNYQYLTLLRRAENTMLLLLETRVRVEQYRAAYEKFPRSACDMGLASCYQIDPITEEPLKWAGDDDWSRLEKTGVRPAGWQDSQNRDKPYPLIYQARPFSVWLWPLSKKRQYALFSDWSIRDLLAEEKE